MIIEGEKENGLEKGCFRVAKNNKKIVVTKNKYRGIARPANVK